MQLHPELTAIRQGIASQMVLTLQFHLELGLTLPGALLQVLRLLLVQGEHSCQVNQRSLHNYMFHQLPLLYRPTRLTPLNLGEPQL